MTCVDLCALCRKCVPANAHIEVKRQLKDLMRRHKEFRSLLLSSSLNQVPVGDMSFANVSMPLDFSGHVPASLGFFDAVSTRCSCPQHDFTVSLNNVHLGKY